MKKEYKAWLISDHYMNAATALFDENVDLLPTRYKNRENTNQSKEEFLLTYALEKISELDGMDGLEGVRTAYWNWVKMVTLGDVAWNGGSNYTDWHYSRAQNAYNKLSELAREPETKPILKAAKKFNQRRNEYFPQFYSLTN